MAGLILSVEEVRAVWAQAARRSDASAMVRAILTAHFTGKRMGRFFMGAPFVAGLVSIVLPGMGRCKRFLMESQMTQKTQERRENRSDRKGFHHRDTEGTENSRTSSEVRRRRTA
jgi:hypothetical protein